MIATSYQAKDAADDVETIAVSKRSISLLPQKEVVKTDRQPFKQETQSLAKFWYVKMEKDTHQPNELYSQMRVMKTYLKEGEIHTLGPTKGAEKCPHDQQREEVDRKWCTRQR